VGGVLLMSALHGPDGQIYAEAQGPLVMGGYSAGSGQNGKEVNSTTVGSIPNGGIIERDTAVDLHDFKTVSLLLRNPDFTTAKQIADAVNAEFHKPVASALDSTRVDVNVADAGASSVPLLISRLQNRHQRADRHDRPWRRCEADPGLRHTRKSFDRGHHFVYGGADSGRRWI
jgi:flagellar P-ring protein precursor FlgI